MEQGKEKKERNFPPLIGAEVSFPCTQEPATGRCPEQE